MARDWPAEERTPQQSCAGDTDLAMGGVMSFRSPKLLAAARDQPCVICGNTGTTVAAHANSVAMGKGTGIKAPDHRIAFLCALYHALVDGRIGRLTKEEKRELWMQGYLKTMAVVFETGIVRVN